MRSGAGAFSGRAPRVLPACDQSNSNSRGDFVYIGAGTLAVIVVIILLIWLL
jgi:hypothetical protein